MRALIVGTGYSLKSVLHKLDRFDGLIFTVNNSYAHVRTDVWLGNDAKWHDRFGKVEGGFDKWHYSPEICGRFGYRYIEGIDPNDWHDGLWLKDKSKVALNHCATAAQLNVALNQYECEEAVLIGHDFHYNNPQRHYFDDVSDIPGEYPMELWHPGIFDKNGRGHDLLAVYREISQTPNCPPIWNATEGSKLPWFEFKPLEDFLC